MMRVDVELSCLRDASPDVDRFYWVAWCAIELSTLEWRKFSWEIKEWVDVAH